MVNLTYYKTMNDNIIYYWIQRTLGGYVIQTKWKTVIQGGSRVSI